MSKFHMRYVVSVIAVNVFCGLALPAIAATSTVFASPQAKTDDEEYDRNGRHWLDEFEEEKLDILYVFPTLRQGSRDKVSVRAAQYRLRSCGYKIAVDGVFGTQTTAAVKRFQAAKKQTVSGVIDESVWSSLVVALKRGSKNPNSVRELQSVLRARGFAVALDGVFGQQTDAAVRRFQSSRGLNEDGLVARGDVEYITWCALLDGRILDLSS